MSKTPKILQIIPADGWQAHFTADDGPEITDPLVCFALVGAEDGSPQVRPMYETDIGIDFCDETGNFSHISKITGRGTD